MDDKLQFMKKKFDACLELEYSNPEYASMHHITVLAFMLQTGRYTPAYKEDALKMLKNFLSHPYKIPSKSTIKSYNLQLSRSKRKGNIFTKSSTKILETKMTILDVRLNTPDHYCEDVIAWAKSIIDIS